MLILIIPLAWRPSTSYLARKFSGCTFELTRPLSIIHFAGQDKKFRVTAYDSIVQIVEPEASFFDYQT